MTFEYDKEFVCLIDLALAEIKSVILQAKNDKIVWLQEDAERSFSVFEKIRLKVVDNTLPVSNGAGLGITRSLGEWAPENLYNAGRDIELYFIDSWKKH